ncbi:MAG: AI-2E family transporter [Clostridia bacterium]
MERKKFFQILVLCICVVVTYFLLDHVGVILTFIKGLWMILTPFVVGGALAFVLNVPMRFLEKRLLCFMDKSKASKRMKRPLALVLVMTLLFVAVYLLLSMIVPEVFNTLRTIVEGIPAFVTKVSDLLKPHGFDLSQYLNASLTLPSAGEVEAQLGNMLDLLLKGAAFSGTLIGSVYDNMLSFFFTVMFTIYFLFAKERLCSQFMRLMQAYMKPTHMQKTLRVGKLTQRTFSSFITGQCLEALILGGLFFLAMTAFGMPYVLLISVFITVTALIPVIGAWMGCIVGALLILISNPMQALGFLALFLVLQQLEGNLIYPHVMGNAIGLPSLWVLFAVVLGQGLMGILGMLLFIPLTSVGYTLLREKVNERLKERELAREV